MFKVLKQECPEAWEGFSESGTLISDLALGAKGGYRCLENAEVPHWNICLYHLRYNTHESIFIVYMYIV